MILIVQCISCFDRRKVLEACRGFKHLFNEARERASKALGFTKKLQNDLENAAKFNIDVPVYELLTRLEASGHVQVWFKFFNKLYINPLINFMTSLNRSATGES